MFSPLGLGWSGEPLKLWLIDEEEGGATSWYSGRGVTDGECVVTVDASHRHETHRWFLERFAEGIHRAVEKRAALYGSGEKYVAQRNSQLAKAPERCIVPKQQPPLRELAGIISRANLHFGNCSAPRHFAVALGVPSLVIVGGNGTTAWTFPSEQHQIAHLYTPCHKCNQKHCPKGTLECLDGLTSEMVLKQFLAMV